MFPYSWSHHFCCFQLNLAWAWGLHPVYASHAYIWAAGVLVSFVYVPLNFSIPLRNSSVYCMYYLSFQKLNTVPTYVLHHSICNFLFLALLSALSVVACWLSLSAYIFVYG